MISPIPSMHAISAISPIDGRYEEKLKELAPYFSEHALIRARCEIEICHLIELETTGVFMPLSSEEKERCMALISNFSCEDSLAVKRIEEETKHDVKACEWFLRRRLMLSQPNRIHFGLTSEDVNNLAYSLCFKRFVSEFQIPLWRQLFLQLLPLAEGGKKLPFPSMTHGQAATPSTVGKEMAVYLNRLLRPYRSLKTHVFRGKLNGATGTYGAFMVAAPEVNWRSYELHLMTKLGLLRNLATTQIEDHDSWNEWMQMTQRFAGTVADLNLDMWNYISRGYVTQTFATGEVGSSTMPHKINPIRFENSEGNLHLASHLLFAIQEKLSRSRMQRDLSESTVTRNIGVAFAHHVLALGETISGLRRVHFNEQACLAALENAYELLSEPIQSALRPVLEEDPYLLLKGLTQGKIFSKRNMLEFIDSLGISSELKSRLSNLKPETYLGCAPDITEDVLSELKQEISL